MGLRWTNNLETGFDRIDDQHKVLFKKLIEFHRACEEGLGRKAIVEMFAFIDRYVTAHFALEEAYMLSKRYPQYEEHRMAHDKLREEYKKLTGVLVEDGVMPAVHRKGELLPERLVEGAHLQDGQEDGQIRQENEVGPGQPMQDDREHKHGSFERTAW